MEVVVVLLLVAFLTFLPFGIAVHRGHKNAVPILVVSILTGWTLVGFCVALVWSLMADQESTRPDRGTTRRRRVLARCPAEEFGFVDHHQG